MFQQFNWNDMKFIETKREQLRRERIALNEQEWPELVELLKGRDWGGFFCRDYAIGVQSIWSARD
jgi:hypothetical protein